MYTGNLTTGEIRKMISRRQGHLVPAEDLEMFLENEQAREFYSPEGIKNLYIMICKDAVDDYKRLKRSLWKRKPGELADTEAKIDLLEKFFGQDLFLNVTGFRNGESAIEKIQEGMKREAKRKMA